MATYYPSNMGDSAVGAFATGFGVGQKIRAVMKDRSDQAAMKNAVGEGGQLTSSSNSQPGPDGNPVPGPTMTAAVGGSGVLGKFTQIDAKYADDLAQAKSFLSNAKNALQMADPSQIQAVDAPLMGPDGNIVMETDPDGKPTGNPKLTKVLRFKDGSNPDIDIQEMTINARKAMFLQSQIDNEKRDALAQAQGDNAGNPYFDSWSKQQLQQLAQRDQQMIQMATQGNGALSNLQVQQQGAANKAATAVGKQDVAAGNYAEKVRHDKSMEGIAQNKADHPHSGTGNPNADVVRANGIKTFLKNQTAEEAAKQGYRAGQSGQYIKALGKGQQPAEGEQTDPDGNVLASPDMVQAWEETSRKTAMKRFTKEGDKEIILGGSDEQGQGAPSAPSKVQPPGAVAKGRGKDNKLHWLDANHKDLGVAE